MESPEPECGEDFSEPLPSILGSRHTCEEPRTPVRRVHSAPPAAGSAAASLAPTLAPVFLRRVKSRCDIPAPPTMGRLLEWRSAGSAGSYQAVSELTTAAAAAELRSPGRHGTPRRGPLGARKVVSFNGTDIFARSHTPPLGAEYLDLPPALAAKETRVRTIHKTFRRGRDLDAGATRPKNMNARTSQNAREILSGLGVTWAGNELLARSVEKTHLVGHRAFNGSDLEIVLATAGCNTYMLAFETIVPELLRQELTDEVTMDIVITTLVGHPLIATQLEYTFTWREKNETGNGKLHMLKFYLSPLNRDAPAADYHETLRGALRSEGIPIRSPARVVPVPAPARAAATEAAAAEPELEEDRKTTQRGLRDRSRRLPSCLDEVGDPRWDRVTVRLSRIARSESDLPEIEEDSDLESEDSDGENIRTPREERALGLSLRA